MATTHQILNGSWCINRYRLQGKFGEAETLQLEVPNEAYHKRLMAAKPISFGLPHIRTMGRAHV